MCESVGLGMFEKVHMTEHYRHRRVKLKIGLVSQSVFHALATRYCPTALELGVRGKRDRPVTATPDKSWAFAKGATDALPPGPVGTKCSRELAMRCRPAQ